MAIAQDRLLSLRRSDQLIDYDDTYTMLYGLAVGFGRDPLDERELPFVYEKNLRTLPTMACALTVPSSRLLHEEAGLNYLMVVAGEKWISLHRPLPVAARLSFDTHVIGAWDKGAGKGAVITTETLLKDRDSGALLCTLRNTTFARGDGGYGGPRDGAPLPHPVPDRACDIVFEAPTAPNQGLLYRLLGDRNPLHGDPATARKAGFPAPILHGLCTFGNCCRAIVAAFCDYDATRIADLRVRLSSPVYPGETLLIRMWKDADIVSFDATVKERDVQVVGNGKCTLRALQRA